MESISLSEDLIKNLINLTSSFKNSVPTSNVDISEIEPSEKIEERMVSSFSSKISDKSLDIPISSDFKLNTVSNIAKMTSAINTRMETDRLLSLKKPDDPHGEFKVDVKELARIEQLISEYSEIIRKLRAKKFELREKTLTHMVQHKVDGVKVSPKEAYSVVVSKKKVNPMTRYKLPISIKNFLIKEEKMDAVEAESLVTRMLKWINDNAEYVIVKSLRHSKK